MEKTLPIHHILMVDDDKDHSIIFKRILEKEFPRVEISFVNDGQQLFHFFDCNVADLIFLDLNMPCKNGYECLQEIKKDGRLKDIPIIIYSSSAHMSDIKKSFINKADFYIVKPYKIDHLKTALKVILSINWKQDSRLRHHYFINNRFVPYTATA